MSQEPKKAPEKKDNSHRYSKVATQAFVREALASVARSSRAAAEDVAAIKKDLGYEALEKFKVRARDMSAYIQILVLKQAVATEVTWFIRKMEPKALGEVSSGIFHLMENDSAWWAERKHYSIEAWINEIKKSNAIQAAREA